MPDDTYGVAAQAEAIVPTGALPIPDDATVYLVARRGDLFGYIPVPRADIAQGAGSALRKGLLLLDAKLAQAASQDNQ